MVSEVLQSALASAGDAIRSLSGHRGPFLSVATLILFWIVYRLATRAIRNYLQRQAHKEENIQNFLLLWRYIWMGTAVVFALISFSGSLTGLGISAAFLGMVVGWSLQAPVTGIAAWLMIILKRPFRIGDRVTIAGIIGDVTDINLTHVILNQVGGTIGGEEKSGRGVLIPNATLFQQIIYNYTLEAKYILDEVPVMITFDSDFEAAERILVQAAREVTGEIIRETGEGPFIRAEIFESGIRIRLRYQALATERQRITSDIARIIIREFVKNPRIRFCYPHWEIHHRQAGPLASGQPWSPPSDTKPSPPAG
jgi:small-conductance mechanosensitive channel